MGWGCCRYITQESHKLEIQARPPIAVTNAVSWRSEGIRYRKNEVFLDVIESLNLLVSSTGNVLRSEILGAVKLKCYLSGMPELRLGLNDKVMFETTGRATRGKAVEMEDVKFHQCVRLSRFENDRTISFIPPDGEFELMSYRLNTQVKPLIWVESDVRSHSGSRIEYTLKARAQFKRRSTANNVEILVPVPEDADTPRFRTNIGSVHYAPEKSAIIWKIKQFGGGKEFLMRAELGLPSVKGDDEHGGGMTGGFGGSMGGAQGGKGKRPISVKFEIPYFTTSGIQVRYLKIIEPKVGLIPVPPAPPFSSGLAFIPCVTEFSLVESPLGLMLLTSLGDRDAPRTCKTCSICRLQCGLLFQHLPETDDHPLTCPIAVAIPILTMGPLHHSVGRHRCEVTGCAISDLAFHTRRCERNKVRWLGCNVVPHAVWLAEHKPSTVLQALTILSHFCKEQTWRRGTVRLVFNDCNEHL